MIPVGIDLIEPVNLDFQSSKVLEVGNEIDFQCLFDFPETERFN